MNNLTGPPDRLNADALIDEAQRVTGLDDFGNDDFRPGLYKLLVSVPAEGQLSPGGKAIVESTITRFLVNRLRFQADLKRHPEILDEVLLPPIVILGLPRTGTTKLHRMMAVDPRLQSLKTWQINNPAPFPEGEKSGRDARISAAEHVDALLDALSPELAAGHATRAEDVEEESVTLMEMNFDFILFAMRFDSPSFEAWVKSRPVLPTYRALYRWLQYLQWQRGDGTPRPYLLKSPPHMAYLDALLEVFPGATLVHCHREPRAAASSFMRLAELGRGLLYESQDLRKLGEWVLAVLADWASANLAQRETLSGRIDIVDVAFKDTAADPLSVIRRICASRGWDLPPATESAMLAWERGHPADRFGKFSYDSARYGVSQAEIEKRFATYSARFSALR